MFVLSVYTAPIGDARYREGVSCVGEFRHQPCGWKRGEHQHEGRCKQEVWALEGARDI